MQKILHLCCILGSVSGIWAQTPVSFYPTTDASGVWFGAKISVFDTNVLVSSLGQGLGPQVGKTYLFDLSSGNIAQTNVFYPSDVATTDTFGQSHSLNNEFIAISAPYHDANFENSGAVYLYRKVAGVWTFLEKLMASDATVNDTFGRFVQIHNNQLFITALNQTTGNGKVYVYSFNGTGWVFNQTLTTSEPYGFGQKIEFEGNKLVVISRESGAEGTARFQTYNYNTSNWIFQHITASLGSVADRITDFSLSADQLFVTSTMSYTTPEDHLDKVSIYDSAPNTGVWNMSATVNIVPLSDHVFNRIEVQGQDMFIGSTEYILQMEHKSPLLQLRKTNGNWVQINSFFGNGAVSQDDYFGSELALKGNILIVGAPSEGSLNTGQAYYFDLLLGNEDFESEKWIVYPNPTKDVIRFNHTEGIHSVALYSIRGELLRFKSSDLDQFSLEGFAAGIYFITISFGTNFTQTIKIIKE